MSSAMDKLLSSNTPSIVSFMNAGWVQPKFSNPVQSIADHWSVRRLAGDQGVGQDDVDSASDITISGGILDALELPYPLYDISSVQANVLAIDGISLCTGKEELLRS